MAAQQDLRFCLLGPLEVVVEGRPLALSGKLRSLLAILLLSRNQVVPRRRLLEALCPGAPEDRAAHRLDVHVSKLRSALRGAGGRLLSRPGGYMLEVSPGELDLERFERLTAEGRRAFSAGDAEEAATRLRVALSLWRGAPLADVELNGGGAGAALEESRLAALEDRIEAEIALGHHAELVSELTELVADYRLRERLCGQLMLCLYRSGRQAEALELYRETRERFTSKLGIEPGRSLKELERAILRQEALLEPPQQRAPRAHAPAPLTSFVGRGRELADLRELILRREVRLVTLTGAGGVGKTRLALEAAQALAGDYEHGVFFVDLAPLRDPGLVTGTVSQAVGAKDGLAEHIDGRQLLLVLDNMEHLLPAGAEVADLLRRCPSLNVLATSRERLRLSGEHVLEVPPLRDQEAVSLFHERARAVRRDYHADGEVSEICRRLDRLPLAIELAAARVAELSSRALLEQLEPCLPQLAEGPLDVPARQQTLGGTIAWSYGLLHEHEKLALAGLSVFAGGCTPEAAAAVCEAGPETLRSLVDKSLLRAEDGRYLMLETIREYALERLAEDEDQHLTRRRHAHYFLGLAQNADHEAAGQGSWLKRLEPEQDNLRSALEWALARDTDTALRLAAALSEFWYMRGEVAEGRSWLGRAAALRPQESSRPRAQLLRGAGILGTLQGDYAEAARCVEASLVLYRDLGDSAGIARCLNNLGTIAAYRGAGARARTLLEESGRLYRKLGDADGLAMTASNLADLALREGQYDRAIHLSHESLELGRRIGNAHGVAVSLHNLGLASLGAGRLTEASRWLSEAFESELDVGDQDGVTGSLMASAAVALQAGDAMRAAELLAASNALRSHAGVGQAPFEREFYEATATAVRARLGEAADAAWERGERSTVEQAVACALDVLRAFDEAPADDRHAAKRVAPPQSGGRR